MSFDHLRTVNFITETLSNTNFRVYWHNSPQGTIIALCDQVFVQTSIVGSSGTHIITALGQVMLYVDGMNGIIAHLETIQWLYELLDSPVSIIFPFFKNIS